MTDEEQRLRNLVKHQRFGYERDPDKTFAKVLPGITKEEAEGIAKRFFTLWPAAAKYIERVR